MQTPRIGETVHLVQPDGAHLPGIVNELESGSDSVGAAGFHPQVGPFQVHSVPFDGTGVAPSSWHYPEA